MTEVQNINADAKSAFDEGNFSLAFQTLWKAGTSHFLAYAEKEERKSKKPNWLSNPGSARFFWDEFILNDSVFDEIFKSDSADQILHNYFSKYNIRVEKFETKLASKFPQVFVKAIRLNQVFLKADRIEHLSSVHLDSKFLLHQKIWKRVFEHEQERWKQVEIELNSVSKYSLQDILSQCIIWLETNRFSASSQQTMHHLGGVYSFFIDLVLNKFPEKHRDILGEDDFFKHFLNNIASTFNEKWKIEESPVSRLLISISQWIEFKERVISPYSFDLNIEPIQQNELVFFNSTPEAYYNWLVNGVRYGVNQLNYLFKGTEVVECMGETRSAKIPGKTDKDIELNRKLAGLTWASRLMLKDLVCEEFKIGNVKIKAEKLFRPLMTYSFNRLNRYENNLEIHSKTSRSWSEAFMKLTRQSVSSGIKIEPFFLMTASEYEQFNREKIAQDPEHFSALMQLFCFGPNQKKYKFERFRQRYDVWQKPFSKIGDFLFCPMMFFANNFWFYSFAQVALLQKTHRSETQKMETYLADRIKHKGWKVKVISDIEASEIEGDVDVFVEDEETLLFIQLKRTYFRLDLKDAYNESVNSDSKAAKQLNDAEIFLEKPNLIYDVKHKPVKWIVSTSFENIGSCINDCVKINYFELLNALDNPEIKNLSDLVTELESDKILKHFITNNSEALKGLGMFQSQNYKQTIFSDDEKETSKYNSLYNEASELVRNGKQNDALVLLQKCISLKPDDGDAHGAIANILADMKLFDQSFMEFKTALELLPNDPHISRNYALALIEAENFYEGLELIFKLLQEFPLLDDIKILFKNHFEKCQRLGRLNPEQILHLQKKWDSMN